MLKLKLGEGHAFYLCSSVPSQGVVGDLLRKKCNRGDEVFQKVCTKLDINHLMERKVSDLSGGELQRFAIAMSCIVNADVYVYGVRVYYCLYSYS